MKTLALIPHYNHPATVTRVAQAMRGFGLDVLIVDDGSRADCKPVLEALSAQGGIDVVYRIVNGGKGAAAKAGLKYAERHGYTHVLQVDADAQHCLDDTAKLLAAAAQNPEAVVCGWPQYGADAPKARLYGRKITDFWNRVHTWSADIKDGMCGFRLYPLAPALAVVREERVGERMDFDTEILIRLYWRGVKPVWVKTPVRYEAGGVSHFRAFEDNVLISKMHARLFCGMVRRRIFGKRPSEHWAAQNERGNRLFLGMTVLMVKYLPAVLMRPCIWFVVLYFYAVSPAARRHAARYQSRLKSTFPDAPLPRRLPVLKQFAAFGEAVCDRFAVWQRKIRYEDLAVDDPDGLSEQVEKGGRGQIFVCSHLGNTEVCRALVSHHRGFRLNVLVHSRHAQAFNEALAKAGADEIRLIQVGSLDTALMMELSRRIDAGEWLAVAADRVPVRGGKTVSAGFLGAQAPMPQGVWLLAALLKTPLNTMFCVKEGGRYRLKLARFSDGLDAGRSGRARQTAEAAQRFADILARECAQNPLQWFNFYDFWNDANNG